MQCVNWAQFLRNRHSIVLLCFAINFPHISIQCSFVGLISTVLLPLYSSLKVYVCMRCNKYILLINEARCWSWVLYYNHHYTFRSNRVECNNVFLGHHVIFRSSYTKPISHIGWGSFIMRIELCLCVWLAVPLLTICASLFFLFDWMYGTSNWLSICINAIQRRLTALHFGKALCLIVRYYGTTPQNENKIENMSNLHR